MNHGTGLLMVGNFKKRLGHLSTLLAVALILLNSSAVVLAQNIPACDGLNGDDLKLCEERVYTQYGVRFLDRNRQECSDALSNSSAPANKSLFIIGDSIGVGLSPSLKTTLGTSWSVGSDTKVGRTLKEGVPLAETYLKTNNPGAVLVVLGTNNVNDASNEADIAAMVKAIKGPHPNAEIFWLEINVTRSDLVSGAKTFNTLLDNNSAVNVLSPPVELGDGVHPKDYDSLAKSLSQSIGGTENSTPSLGCKCGGVEVGGGSNNEETAFKFFVGSQYTKEQSAGIVGNLIAESGVNPKIIQGGGESDTPTGSGGYGIAQWTPGTKILEDAKAAGSTPGDLGFQLQLLVDQLAGKTRIAEKAAGDHLKLQKTVADAAKSFMTKYERPKDQSSGRQNERARLAEGVFQRYASTTSGASTTTGSSCDGSAATDQILDGFVVYSQTDGRWSSKPYGSSTVGETGCGPSAVAMIVSTWIDKSVTPDKVAEKYKDYYVKDQGSKHTLIPDALAEWGLKTEAIGKDMQSAKTALQNGKLVVAVGKGADPFTDGGHFIVLRGITKEGKILIGDSGHSDTSAKEWDDSIISAGVGSEGGEMWIVSK